MGRLTALAVLSVLTLFTFLLYQEYIQGACVSTLLCSGFDSQANEASLLQTQSANISEVNNSNGVLRNDTVQDSNKSSSRVPNNMNTGTKEHVSGEDTETKPTGYNETNLIVGITKIESTYEMNRTENSPSKTQEFPKPKSEPSSVRNFTIPKMKYLEAEPTPGDKHIIFIETRCLLDDSQTYSGSGLSLHKRQACVIESAAKMNPDYKVYLLYSCPINGRLEDSSEYVQTIFTYPNVKLWKLKIARHFSKTPLEKWNFRAAMNSSAWPKEHSSDVLRFLTLWKYGGTYLDLDVIILKSLDELDTDYVGTESKEAVASCVLSFASSGIGHAVADRCVEELRSNFRGHIWTYNGPGLITRVLLKMCHSTNVAQLSTVRCKGFKILSEKEFFPIPYQSWELFFNESTSYELMETIKDSFGVHVWNKLSKNTEVRVGSKQPYSLMAAKACPRMYSVAGHSF